MNRGLSSFFQVGDGMQGLLLSVQILQEGVQLARSQQLLLSLLDP
jgi:hypothetical protein